MILHFLLDEKIAEQIISNFEGISSDNKYLVFVKEKEKFKYIKDSHQNIILFIRDDFVFPLPQTI